MFDRLRPDAPVPITDGYVYRTSLVPGCSAQPVLTAGADVLGVLSTAPDGRERLALTVTMPTAGTGLDLLGYGLVRWATRGVLLGEQRQWLAVDVDDWFLPTQLADGSTFRLTGAEAQATADGQDALRARHPLAAQLTLTLAFNASTFVTTAPRQCDPAGTPDALSSYTLCLAGRFRWINHTFAHPALNTTSYAETRAQITDNLQRADQAGLTVPRDVLKTPEYSGLGFFADRPGGEATDHGLGAANQALLRAAADVGVRWLHGNLSFPSHRPTCANCTTAIPGWPALALVPDWPTSISFQATTPAEAVAAYNAVYGAHGSAPTSPPHDVDYAGLISAEADLAFSHVSSGSAAAHTLHQGNLHQYAPGHSLVLDWLDAVLERYDRYYAVPLLDPDWPTLAAYAADRTSHFAGVAAGDDAVWNRVTRALTLTPAATGRVFVTGIEADGLGQAVDPADPTERYGSDTVTRVALVAGRPVAFMTGARP